MTHDDLMNKHHDLLHRCGYLEIQEGWYPLVDNLCSELTSLIEQGHPQIHAVQVKSKFGGLRFYTEGEPSTDQVHLIDDAERISKRTCETCGEHGAQTVKMGWVYTACEKHK